MVQTIKRQRIRRAEQQERVDIYSQLSESSVKSFSGGFTRPKIFRALNRLEFDPWANETERRRAWSLVKPLDDAYRPHSVLLLATRYPVIHQIGEPSHVDFKVEYCAREDVKSRLELWNGKPAMFRNNLGLWVQTEPPEDARDKYESALWPNEEARQRRRMPKLEAWEGIEQETLLQAEATADGGDRAPSHHETKGPQAEYDSASDPGAAFPFRTEDESPERLAWSRSRVLANRTLPSASRKSEGMQSKGTRTVEEVNESIAAFEAALSDANSGRSTEGLPEVLRPSRRLGDDAPESTGEIAASVASPAGHGLQAPIATETGASKRDTSPTNLATRARDPRLSSLRLPLTRPHLRIPGPPFTSEPFWIPLVRVDLPTRPIAESVGRLASALERGLPYHGAVPPPDRKDGAAYARRQLALRMERLQRLVVELTRRLKGEKGGLMGARFRADQKGWGVEGEAWNELPEFDPIRISWLREEEGGLAEDSVLRTEFSEACAVFGDTVEFGVMQQFGEDVDSAGRLVPYVPKPLKEGQYGSALAKDGKVKIATYEKPSKSRKTLPPADVLASRRKMYIEDGQLKRRMNPGEAARVKSAMRAQDELARGLRHPDGWKREDQPGRGSFFTYRDGSVSVSWDDSPLGRGDAEENHYVPLPKLAGDDLTVSAADIRESLRELNQARTAELRRLRFTGEIHDIHPRKSVRQVLDENIAAVIAPGSKSWWELRRSLARFGLDIYDVQRKAGWEFAKDQPARFVGRPVDVPAPPKRLPADFGLEVDETTPTAELNAEDRARYDALSRRARMQGRQIDSRALRASAIDTSGSPLRTSLSTGRAFADDETGSPTDIDARADALESEFSKPVDLDVDAWAARMRELAKFDRDTSNERRGQREGSRGKGMDRRGTPRRFDSGSPSGSRRPGANP